MLSRRDAVERKIRMNPGIGMKELTNHFKCNSKAITNAIVGLKEKGINFIGKITGAHKERQVFYTIVKSKHDPVNRTVSNSFISNPTDSIKPRRHKELTVSQIVATFSEPDRQLYFVSKEKGIFAELLVAARRQRLIEESEVPRV